MSDTEPVDPVGIPVFTGDLALLDTKVTALSGHGAAIATAAGDVHSSFGGLSAFYKAPEAEQLFATTAPVAATGLSLSSDLCVIAGALSTYSDDAFPLVEKLKELKRDAVAFRVEAEGDDKWREDGDLVEENNRRRNEIAEVWTAFQEVERACHAKIVALVGGKALKIDDGSGKKEGVYGYDAEALKQAKSLPWGEAVEESTPWWQVWEHAYDFGKGFLVDGVWGTLKGLGTLAGFEGGDAAKEAWTGLAKLATGLSPAAMLVLHVLPGDHSAWIRDSQTAVQETGKALIAWDQWGSNPSRAAGAVTFNVLTTVFTGGTGGAAAGAGKAGLAAKALSLTSKTARAVDPMTYVFKGAGAGLSKISDVMAGLKGLGKFEAPTINVDGAIALPEGAVHLPDGAIHLPSGSAVPDGAIKLPDGNIKLPEGTTTFPPGTVKLPVDGPSQFMDPKGNIYDAAGDITQHAKDAPTGKPDAGADIPRVDAPKVDSPATAGVPERELVGVGGRDGDDAIRLGSDISDPLHRGDHTPDHTPGGHAGDQMPTNNLDSTPRGGGHADGPSGTSHGDGPSSTGGHTEGPGGGGHHEPPSAGGGTHLPENPGTWTTRRTARMMRRTRRTPPGDRQLTAEEIKVKQDEFVRRANDPDKSWFDLYYRSDGHRHSIHTKIDGVELPILAKDSDGSWISKHDLPSAPSEIRYGRDPLTRGSTPVDQIDHLDDVAKDRKVSVDLSNAERAHKAAPTEQTLAAVERAREQFIDHFDDQTSNNSSYSERLGEDAARLHVVPERFEGAVEQPLPKTPNGANMFDQLHRRPDGKLVIIEAKAPSSGLIWRRGKGAAEKFMVQQGTSHYLETIISEREARPLLSVTDSAGKTWTNADLAAELRPAFESGNLEYAMVKAVEGKGTYAGAVLEYFKISIRQGRSVVTSVSRQSYPVAEMGAVVPVMEKSLANSLQTIGTSHRARSGALTTSLNVARVRCVGDPDAVMLETWESWLLTMQVHSAVFAATFTDQETVACKIQQEERQLATTGPQIYLNAGTWLNAFFLALICRETARLDMLARVPASLLRDCGGVLDEYVYAWVETLRSFWLRHDDVSQHLVRAVDLSAPEVTHVLDAETMSKLEYPPIMMFYRYLRNDAAGFNEALNDALCWHKEYWTADEDRVQNIEGVVSIAPLAVACLAKANGIPTEVESGYLPTALLDFAWRGEFDA